jgi:hypothetical protein
MHRPTTAPGRRAVMGQCMDDALAERGDSRQISEPGSSGVARHSNPSVDGTGASNSRIFAR